MSLQRLLLSSRPRLASPIRKRYRIYEREYVASDDTRSFHDRYLEIYKLIDARDGDLARVFDSPRRSQAVLQLALIHSHDLLESEELARFTSETRSAIDSLSELSRR